TIAWVACSATSYSGTSFPAASTQAAPPRSAMRAPLRMTSISSADLTMRRRIVAGLASTSSTPGTAASSLARPSSVRWSNSTPSRRVPFASPATAWNRLSNLAPQPRVPVREPGHGVEPVVALPVGVDDVVAVRAPPRLAPVDVRADRRLVVGGAEKAVATRERAVQEVGVVVYVVDRGEQHRVHVELRHGGAQAGEAA